MATHTQRPEPSDWLFDGTDPAADLPPSEADRIADLSLVFDDPICSRLPESSRSAVRELFRGHFAHTPYRRFAGIEREDERTLLVRAEKREHANEAEGWEPHIHDRTIEALQDLLIDFFGPLWRIHRKRSDDSGTGYEPGTVVVRRVKGRHFHYREEHG